MAEHGNGENSPGGDTVEGMHGILLWLAGRIDDDLLAWARELVAVGEDDHALDLIIGTITASRVALPPPVRHAVIAAARRMGVEDATSADSFPSTTGAGETTHRFRSDLAGLAGVVDAGEQDAGEIEAALAESVGRKLPPGRVWRTWRLTPAGTAPGPVPHPVVLIELEPDSGAAEEVVAYQVADALRRAGVGASVEVFLAGTELPDYHREALGKARTVSTAAGQPAAGLPITVRPRSQPITGQRGGDRAPMFEPAAQPVAAFDPAARARPAHRPPPAEPSPSQPSTPPSTPDGFPAINGGIGNPYARRSNGESVRSAPADRHPRPAPESPHASAARDKYGHPRPAPDDHFGSPMADPLNDPLTVPLLDPLLDPTPLSTRTHSPARPEPARPEPARPGSGRSEPARTEPAAGLAGSGRHNAPVDRPARGNGTEESDGWLSGEWPRSRGGQPMPTRVPRPGTPLDDDPPSPPLGGLTETERELLDRLHRELQEREERSRNSGSGVPGTLNGTPPAIPPDRAS